jgi:hypothetical protein
MMRSGGERAGPAEMSALALLEPAAITHDCPHRSRPIVVDRSAIERHHGFSTPRDTPEFDGQVSTIATRISSSGAAAVTASLLG